MKIIQVHKFKSSGFRPEFDVIRTIEIEENDVGSGSYGKVYACTQVNGLGLRNKQAIKLLVDDGTGSAVNGMATIVGLQEQILLRAPAFKAEKNMSIHEVNALAALPQFSFEGTLDGEAVMGYSADMLEGGYMLFDKLFVNENAAEKKALRVQFYSGLPRGQRLKFAYDLVEGFKILQELSYIHADLNPKNFFIHIPDNKLCIIDYDSGAVINDRSDEAITFGKLGDWLAPEIQEQLTGDEVGNIIVNLHTDIWSVAIAIHFMLFHFHPFFFLKQMGVQDMKDYFSKYKWPAIQEDDPNFKSSAVETYRKYLVQLKKEVPDTIEEGFRVTFHDGFYKPHRRLSYAQWKIRLTKLMEPAIIKDLIPDREVVVAGLPVLLSWKADRAHRLVIDHGVGEVTGKAEIAVKPMADTTYTLTAIGHFGEAKKAVSVAVVPIPPIELQPVPIPDFGEVLSLDLGHFLPFHSSVIMNTDDIKLPSFSHSFGKPADYLNEAGAVYNSISELFPVSGIFDTLKEKINNQVNPGI